MFGNMLGDLVNHRSYQVDQGQELQPGVFLVRVSLVGAAGQPGEYDFTMVRKERGLKVGSWMTKSLLKVKS